MKNPKQQPIFIVEDNPDDYLVIERSLKKAEVNNDLRHFESGEEIMQHISKPGAVMPSLILLDLNLPGTDGREILRLLKGDPNLNKIPVIIFSTSAHEKDINDCYRMGANCYIEKPISYKDYLDITVRLRDFWLTCKYTHLSLVDA